MCFVFMMYVLVLVYLFCLFFFSSRRRHTRCALVTGVQTCALPILDAIARRLGAGKRTLQRRIEAEGTSYQAVLNATREALARHYLEQIGRASCRERVCQYV